MDTYDEMARAILAYIRALKVSLKKSNTRQIELLSSQIVSEMAFKGIITERLAKYLAYQDACLFKKSKILPSVIRLFSESCLFRKDYRFIANRQKRKKR